MSTNKVLLVIFLIVFFVFISYHVVMGLMYATALQGFSGLMLILSALIGLVLVIFNIIKN